MGRAENNFRLEMLLEVVDPEAMLIMLFTVIMSSAEAEKYLTDLENEYQDTFGYDEN